MDKKIEADRQVALGLLKPSSRELEHGLELHAGSVVFDAYGFSPMSAVDGALLRGKVEAGLWPSQVRDCREEMMMTRHVFDAACREEFQEAWNASGVTCVFQNSGGEGNDPATMLKRFSHGTFATDALPGFLGRAAFPRDIEAAKQQGKHCLYHSTNGVPLPPSLDNAAAALAYLQVFFHLGCRMCHLTYNRRNLIGDGCAESSDGGLSDFGREVVKEMNRVGIIPDGAHSGEQTCLEAARASSKPVVVSHSSCHALHPHCRAKSDEVIKAVADTGGYIGICCVGDILGGDVNAFLDHIGHVVERFGADHVAIGTDFAYVPARARDEHAKVPPEREMLRGWESFWPEGSFPGVPERTMASLSWTNWPLFTVGLVQRGHSDEAIRKIIGGNVMRVAQRTLPEGL